MAIPTILAVHTVANMPDYDAVSEHTWSRPPGDATAYVYVHLAANSCEFIGTDTYGGVPLVVGPSGCASSYSINRLYYLLDLSGLVGDTRSHFNHWSVHQGHELMLSGVSALADTDVRAYTDWSYTGMNPLTLDPAGQDCLAIVVAEVDESTLRVNPSTVSNGATVTQHVVSAPRPCRRVQSFPVLASDGPVTVTTPVNGQAVVTGILLAGIAASRKRNQAIVVM